MEQDFLDFMAARCEKALTECEEYMEKEYAGEVTQEELMRTAERLCYEKGFKDCLAILMYSQKI